MILDPSLLFFGGHLSGDSASLGFKWIHILYRRWQTRTPYDEVVYLKALERRGSPLLTEAKMT